jgi:hypothetical protein
MTTYHDFQDELAWSEGKVGRAGIDRVLLDRIPGATSIRNPTDEENKEGIDAWVERGNGLPAVRVDHKTRATDPRLFSVPQDDLALEIWSDIDRRKIGWTRDRSKKTDWIIWYWIQTGRFCLVPFLPLCFAMEREWEKWTQKYRSPIQTSNFGMRTWKSQCVFVPRDVVYSAFMRWANSFVPESFR